MPTLTERAPYYGLGLASCGPWGRACADGVPSKVRSPNDVSEHGMGDSPHGIEPCDGRENRMKTSDLAAMEIERVIVHKVPERLSRRELQADGASQSKPELSGAPSPLDNEMARYLEERVTTSLQERGFPVFTNSEAETDVPGQVSELLNASGHLPDREFVAISREMATALHAAQAVGSNKGLFALMEGNVGVGVARQSFVAVMKFEEEVGVRLEMVDASGQQTWKIILDENIVLTEKTKVFKVGVFRLAPPDDPGAEADGGENSEATLVTDGIVADMQTGLGFDRVVADFWLRKYLGCELVDVPEVHTKRVFDVLQAWANHAIEDGSTRVEVEEAIFTSFLAPKATFNPTEFRDEYVPEEYRDSLDRYMQEADVPTTSFNKDRELIDGKLKRLVIELGDDVRVLAPPAMLKTGKLVVDTVEDEAGDTTVTVKGPLKKVHGGS